MSEPIDVTQDWEVFDGELGARLNVFWAPGHGHDALDFIRAVVEFSLDETESVPRIDEDVELEEVWQSIVHDGEGVWVYDRRSGDKPAYESMRGPVDWTPVTVLDLDRRRRGAPKCAIEGCRIPWSVGHTIKVVVEPGDDVRPKLRVALCREHRDLLPKPFYLLALVPIGSEVVLSAGST